MFCDHLSLAIVTAYLVNSIMQALTPEAMCITVHVHASYLSVIPQLLNDIIKDFSPKPLFSPTTIFLWMVKN